MAATPPPQQDRKMNATGLKLLLLSGVLAAIGLVVVLAVDGGTAEGIGVVFLSIACLPGVAGLALVGSSIVSKRSREGKPFA
jgi:hypothetical protein